MSILLLSDIERNPSNAFDYLERLVNNGSKSGFTDIHNTSKGTNPFYSDGYRILKLIADNVETIGEIDTHAYQLDIEGGIYIHPDWMLIPNNGVITDLFRAIESEQVVPTSSSRTVRVANQDVFIKLHYPGLIGRLKRDLGFEQLISGIELTSIFNNSRNNQPEFFDYMPEPYGKILHSGNNQVGYILRTIPPHLKKYYLIPGFSMFSVDRQHPEHPTILEQVLEKRDNALEYFVYEICLKLIDVFFWCALEEGLIPEMHSQNIVFAFDTKWRLKKIVLRDFESIDKDITIRTQNDKDINFQEYPYKCIAQEDDNYLKRHSFMYDHKLGEYLIDPLVEEFCKFTNLNTCEVQAIIRENVRSKYSGRLAGFFPQDGFWYKYPDIEIDRSTSKRPFISMGTALYR